MKFPFNYYWHFLLLCLLSPARSADEAETGDNTEHQFSNSNVFDLPHAAALLHDSLTPNSLRSKRKSRCPSANCKVSLDKHSFGPPHINCNGPPWAEKTKKTSSKTVTITSPSTHLPADINPSTPVTVADLRRYLDQLEAEGIRLESSVQEEQQLREAIAAKEAELHQLRASRSAQLIKPSPPLTSNFPEDLNRLFQSLPSSQNLPSFPSIFQSQFNAPPDFTRESPILQAHQPRSLATIYKEQESRHAEMFLRPTTTNMTASKGKPLRIVDFVSRLTPHEEERVIQSDDQARLTLTLGRKKPKLETITMADYSIANIRIFYELLSSNKLPTPADIRDYLSYSVKIFELSKKHTWTSVLKYDDEFRVLQHTYSYPWDKDNNHLHEVLLLPRWSANQSSHGSGTLNSTAPLTFPQDDLGREICRNFNRQKGCTESDCKFSHVCNRKIGNKACSKQHPGCHHFLRSPHDN